MTSILCGLGFVLAGAVLFWLYESIKSKKDPDVQAASNLRMSVNRFRKYQRLYDEFFDCMMKYGVHSSIAEKKFVEIFKQIDNPNEWKRYQDYRGMLQRRERDEIFKETFLQKSVGKQSKRIESANILLATLPMLLIIIIGIYFSLSDNSEEENDFEEYVINENPDVVQDADNPADLKSKNITGHSDGTQSEDDIIGETYTYYPEDGSIRDSSGKIISKGTATYKSENGKKIHSQEVDINKSEYQNIQYEHFYTGEIPFYSVYGRGEFDKESLSYLRISNESSTDAVVLLCSENGNVLRNVFVRKNSEFTMKQIPAYRCIIKVMYGNNWYKEKDNGLNFPKGGFTSNVTYSVSKWSDAFDFNPKYSYEGVDYPTYELTLHKVLNGNFQTKQSNKNEFFNN